MKKYAICTVSTQSHIFKVNALFSSVRRFSSVDLFCLITDSSVSISLSNGKCHTLNVLDTSLAMAIKKKYKGNELRWSCKSLYLSYLISLGYDGVIYVDNDTYFFSSPDFLFLELLDHSVLLTPHFYPSSPTKNQVWLEVNFRVGLYNAGFIGISSFGVSAMEWWASCCLYNIKKSAERGLFDDQKYLDLLPVLFESVKVVKHKGCNVAGWNLELSPRSLGADGNVYLDGKWPLVFVHFAPTTIRAIINGNDNFLKPFFKEYISNLQIYKPAYDYTHELRRSFPDLLAYFRYIRWRLVRMFE